MSAVYAPVKAKENVKFDPHPAPKSKPVVRLGTCDREGIDAFNAAIDRKEHKSFADLEKIIKAAHEKILCTKKAEGVCMLSVYLKAIVEVIKDESPSTDRAGGVVAKCDNSAQAMITRAVQQMRPSMNSMSDLENEEADADDLLGSACDRAIAREVENEFEAAWSLEAEKIEAEVRDEIVDGLMGDLMGDLVKGALHPIHKIRKPETAAAPTAIHSAASAVGTTTAAALAPASPSKAPTAAAKK